MSYAEIFIFQYAVKFFNPGDKIKFNIIFTMTETNGERERKKPPTDYTHMWFSAEGQRAPP